VSVAAPKAEVVLLAHGSKDTRHGAGVQRIQEHVAARLARPVHAAYLELSPPHVGDLALPAGSPVVLVPLFLSPGYHLTVDVPRVAAGLADDGHRVATASAPLMTGSTWPAALLSTLPSRRVDATVLVVTAGSSRREVLRSWDDAVRHWTRQVGPVRVAHASGPGLRPAEVAQTAQREGAPVVSVVPALVSEGYFADRIRASAAQIGAVASDVVGSSVTFADEVAHRSARALAGLAA
jgi:sirohydrochlorin ferrochelatase